MAKRQTSASGAHAPVKISRITPDQWERLKYLRLRALAESPHALLGDHATESARTETDWRRKCRTERWFSAEINGRIAGLGMLAGSEDSVECMHIESMWVDPLHRNAGIGHALVERIESDAVELSQHELGLWVFAANPSAKRFYRALGYHGTGKQQELKTGDTSTTVEEEFQKNLH